MEFLQYFKQCQTHCGCHIYTETEVTFQPRKTKPATAPRWDQGASAFSSTHVQVQVTETPSWGQSLFCLFFLNVRDDWLCIFVFLVFLLFVFYKMAKHVELKLNQVKMLKTDFPPWAQQSVFCLNLKMFSCYFFSLSEKLLP